MDKSLELKYWLDRYINKTTVWPDGTVVMIKELLGTVRNMKVEMYANDHNPPHFHVKSNCGSINATFNLYDGTYLKGIIDGKDRKRIQAFYNSHKVELIQYWEQKVIKQR